jgi:hypothetical protein
MTPGGAIADPMETVKQKIANRVNQRFDEKFALSSS